MCTQSCPFHSQSAASLSLTPFFFFLPVPEWRDAPQRSWTWISFGLTLWKGQMRAPRNGSEAFTSPSQGPESLHHPENGTGPSPSGAALTRTRRVPWAPMTSFGPPVASASPQQRAEKNRGIIWAAKSVICRVERNFFKAPQRKFMCACRPISLEIAVSHLFLQYVFEELVL